jgi:glycosyltransferase involved in cell wall biosynthesis
LPLDHRSAPPSPPTRLRVLVLAGYYLPGDLAGGPIRSIANLVQALGDEFDFRILTSDRDLRASAPYPAIAPRTWLTVGKAQVVYLPPGARSALFLLRELRRGEYDLLYLNSFFARLWSMAPIFWRKVGLLPERPLMLAPRGEFSPGALAIKPRRKRLYRALARWSNLYADVTWHASYDLERTDIQRQFGVRPIIVTAPLPASGRGRGEGISHPGPVVRVAADLPTVQPQLSPLARPVKQRGELRVIFLSRISRKKNLDQALRVLGRCTDAIAFDIYGPAEDGAYWKECLALLHRLPPNITARWQGSVSHDAVGALFRQYHLFFFPTRGENFGHVISEALGAGCPVLISDQTPWRELAAAGVGWDLPLADETAFVVAIEHCAALTNEDFDLLSSRAEKYEAARRGDPLAISQNRELLLSVGRGALR